MGADGSASASSVGDEALGAGGVGGVDGVNIVDGVGGLDGVGRGGGVGGVGGGALVGWGDRGRRRQSVDPAEASGPAWTARQRVVRAYSF